MGSGRLSLRSNLARLARPDAPAPLAPPRRRRLGKPLHCSRIQSFSYCWESSVESGAAPSPQFCELSLPGSRSRPASSPLTTGRSRETVTYGFLLDVSWVCLRIDDREHGRMGKSRHVALCA